MVSDVTDDPAEMGTLFFRNGPAVLAGFPRAPGGTHRELRCAVLIGAGAVRATVARRAVRHIACAPGIWRIAALIATQQALLDRRLALLVAGQGFTTVERGVRRAHHREEARLDRLLDLTRGLTRDQREPQQVRVVAVQERSE
jgi:hypothetical protein